jgi:hypothetical protein
LEKSEESVGTELENGGLLIGCPRSTNGLTNRGSRSGHVRHAGTVKIRRVARSGRRADPRVRDRRERVQTFNVTRVRQGVDRRVQPPSTLADEVRCLSLDESSDGVAAEEFDRCYRHDRTDDESEGRAEGTGRGQTELISHIIGRTSA